MSTVRARKRAKVEQSSRVARYLTVLVHTIPVFSPRTAARELCSCIAIYYLREVSG